MGRKKKTTIDVLPLHIQEEKRLLEQVSAVFGNDGYAVVLRLQVEMSTNTLHYVVFESEVDMTVLSRSFFIAPEKLQEILDFLAKENYIDKKLWKAKVIWMPLYIEKIKGEYQRRKTPIIQYKEVAKQYIKPIKKQKSNKELEDKYRHFIELFEHITGQTRPPEAWKKRTLPLFKKLIEKYDYYDFEKAIKNACANEWIVENNHLTPEFICRPEQFDKYLNPHHNPPRKIYKGSIYKNGA